MAKATADIHWIDATVSEGTLKTADLLERFATTLRKIAEEDPSAHNRNDTFEMVGRAELMAELLKLPDGEDAHLVDAMDSAAEHVLDVLIELLDDAAPEGCTFGTHEGDGALFGFWSTGKEED